MTKLKDVAEKAKVSMATASLALNDSSLINIKTKEKVREWAKKLNYYPNIAAQRLARGRSYNICLMLNSGNFFKASNIYYLRVIGGIIKKAENTKYTIKFVFYGDTESYDARPHDPEPHDLIGFKRGDLNVKNIDGIIIFDVIDEEMLGRIKAEVDVPLVLVDNHMAYPEMLAVDNDDFGGAYKATKYLIESGHRKIGYIGIPDVHPLGEECWNGFKKALSESGLKEFLKYKKCKLGIRSGRRAIEELIKKGMELPTAFFCVNDFIAIGAMEEFKRRGYKIPDDFSFIAMDDMDLSSEIEPPLTTVRINMENLGQVGMEKLISIINNEYKGEIKTVIGNEVIERGSCKRL